MELIACLAELARQVRHSTLQSLDRVDRMCLTWAPPGTSNHILWHAGHALLVNDVLTVEPLTGRSEMPRGWDAMFGENSQPAAVTTWPDVSEVRSLLMGQLDRNLELLSEHADAIVTRANEITPSGGWPLLAGIIHGWHDEARHQGEMHLLYKLSRANQVAGR